MLCINLAERWGLVMGLPATVYSALCSCMTLVCGRGQRDVLITSTILKKVKACLTKKTC